MIEKSIETISPNSRQQGRQWLQENHCKKRSIWLVYYKRKSSMPTVDWSEAVDEALYFGWIVKNNLLTKKNTCSFSVGENRIVPGRK
jgi:uncharacterized protein YdeI (YjbR/CyaY-like superfamily)